MLDFFTETTSLDAIAVCDDPPNTKVAKIEDSTSIITTPDEAIIPRREKEIENLTPRPIAVSLDGGSNASSKEQITSRSPNVMRTGRSEADEVLTSDECSEEDCDYVCCKCLGSFQQDVAEKNGAEWVMCGCGQ